MRFQDWTLRLDNFLQEHRQSVFAWGHLDCGLFAASWIQQATGNDFGARFRGRYDSAETAQAVMAEAGFAGMGELASGMLGEPLGTVKKAQRGDVVLASERAGGCLGVVDLSGRHFAALTENKGLVRLSLSLAATAWRV